MDTKIIGQGYNLDADTSVAKELIEQFSSKRYDSFTAELHLQVMEAYPLYLLTF